VRRVNAGGDRHLSTRGACVSANIDRCFIYHKLEVT